METIIFLATGILQVYEIDILCKGFFKEQRTNRLQSYVAYFITYCLISFPYLLFNIPVLNTVCSFLGIIVTAITYKGTVKKQIASMFLFMATMCLSEGIVSVGVGVFIPELFRQNEYYSLTGTVCLPIVQLVVVLLLRNFSNIRDGEHISAVYWIISIFLPISSIVMFYLFCRNITHNDVAIITCVIILIVINVFVFYLYDEVAKNYKLESKSRELELQTKYQEQQLKTMNDSVEKIRALKHEFKKHFSMLETLSESKNYEELNKYLQEINAGFNQANKYIESGNIVIDSILNYKLQEMYEKDIKVDTEIVLLEKLDISFYDFNIILGNLLDNSIEAAEQTEEKYIKIYITYRKHKLNIEIHNTTNNKVDMNNVKTTKKDTVNHGYGIKNIKEILNKYESVYDAEQDGNMFKTKMCIFM